jgi:4-aminobutyrate aminotransferase-like enzyme
LNVAIEEQTGLGRIGEAFWEFARGGAVPDIVVIGESMANGLPMAAVVTRADLAAPFDVFANWAEGAGAVECAAAGAVLDVLDVPKLDLGLDGLRGSGLCYEIDVPDAAGVAARLRDRRILIRARGESLLFRPPLTFTAEEAALFVEGLRASV